MSRSVLSLLLLVSALGAVPLRAAVPTMAVSEIRPGMQGVVYTVLQGTTIEPLQVDILGVTENSIGPGHDMIVGKLVDPKTSLIETVHGMSGSPLYIDGKLAGALAYRLTSFEKDGHCGFTPIANMLEVDALPAGEPNASSAPSEAGASAANATGSLTAFLGGNGLAALPGVDGSAKAAYLDVPLSVNGLAPEALRGLLKNFGLGGADVLPVAGGSDSEARLAHVDLIPGAAVAAVLMSGDISMAGTGTLTWREGKRILGFGHPMMGIGRSAWGMAPAEIVTTIPSYYMPYKLSNTGPVVGAIVQDRVSGISGVIGATPAMAPYHIERIHEGQALPALNGAFSTEQTMTPLLADSAVAGAVAQVNQAGRTLFLRATGSLQLQGLPALRLDGVYSGEDLETTQALLSLLEPLRLLYAQDWVHPVATGLDLKLETAEQLRSWTVEDARLDARVYDPGAAVALTVLVRERYGKLEERHFAFNLPAGLKAGTGAVRLRVADGETLDHAALARAIPAFDDAAQLIDFLNRHRRQDALYVQLVTEAPGQVVADRELPALPPSVLGVMGNDNRGEEAVALHEQVWYETSAALPGVVSGEETLQLDIRP